MDNLFVNGDFFDWQNSGSRHLRWSNYLLEKAGFGARLRATGSTGYMTNIEQRINLYHLVSQILAYHVPGDLAEIGTYAGTTAVLVQWVIDGEGKGQQLHVYDSFEKSWGSQDPLIEMKRNFETYCGKLPVVHKGSFETTIPSQLSEAIGFVNIDCGYGGPPNEHGATIRYVLEHVYPRLATGGICSIIDYWRPDLHMGIDNPNPGVQPAVDKFLTDKPETISVLFARDYTHAYFRKL